MSDLDTITIFMRSFRKRNLPKLTPDQERELIGKAQAGDIEARTAVIMANIPFALDVAKRYYHHAGTSRADIMQAAFYGLVSSVDQYDVRYGTKFITYAYFWVKRYILQEINDLGPIHLPIGYARRLERGLLSEAAARATEQYLRGFLSLDGPSEEGKESLGRNLSDKGVSALVLSDAVDREQITNRVQDMISAMPEPTQAVIRMRMDSRTLVEVAQELDLSIDAVRQHEELAKTIIYKRWGRRTIY